MRQLEDFTHKVHGRVYNQPFFIIKHETGEIYKISNRLLTIFNERERYAEAKFVKTTVNPINNYKVNFLDQDWQNYLDWEEGIQEPVSVSLQPSELYFMTYDIVNDDQEHYVTHIYLLDRG